MSGVIFAKLVCRALGLNNPGQNNSEKISPDKILLDKDIANLFADFLSEVYTVSENEDVNSEIFHLHIGKLALKILGLWPIISEIGQIREIWRSRIAV